MSKRFRRQGWKIKRVGTSWRRPRGKQSKLRQYVAHKGLVPDTGYMTPKSQRYKHPSGLYEVRIFNATGLDKINPKTHAVRIASSVGRRTRVVIAETAKKLGLRLLNPQRTERLQTKKTSPAPAAKPTEAKK